MAINRNFIIMDVKLPGGDITRQIARPREIVQIGATSGGRPMEERKTVVDADHPEFAWALVTYKSMEEVIKENPNHFFDGYGNFNTGRTPNSRYPIGADGVHEHLAPSYFGQMGHTAHRRYMKEDGIQDTWYYTVIDR